MSEKISMHKILRYTAKLLYLSSIILTIARGLPSGNPARGLPSGNPARGLPSGNPYAALILLHTQSVYADTPSVYSTEYIQSTEVSQERENGTEISAEETYQTFYTPSPADLSSIIEYSELGENGEATVETLTNLLYGEARGESKLFKSAVVWVVLNRYDTMKTIYTNGETKQVRAYGDSIIEVCTAPSQFTGYKSTRSYDTLTSDSARKAWLECKDIVLDVLCRWKVEREINPDTGNGVCFVSVGRTIDREFLYFRVENNGKCNFRDKWRGGRIWEWELESPYGE